MHILIPKARMSPLNKLESMINKNKVELECFITHKLLIFYLEFYTSNKLNILEG